MNRLHAEQQRLYLSNAPGVRAMVLALAQPAGWAQLSKVWQGAQADLELPAPAIAVSGTDSYQLWFSLAQPVPAVQAMAFLASLCGRYLADVPPARIRLTACDAAEPGRAADVLPPVEREPGQWSAFVTPDLAAVFEDSPWLDLPPGDDAQADLLSRLASIKPEVFERALAQLAPVKAPAPSQTHAAGAAVQGQRMDKPGSQDPRRFLLGVMNDPSVDMHLRIEAAKALLPHVEGQQP